MDHPLQTTLPLLNIEKLKVHGGSCRILKGIDWKIMPDEHWAIIGANGCGKTSLLAAITAYCPHSAGDIHFMGETYGHADWRKVRQHMGMVSSATSRRVPDHESALETVLSGKEAQLGYWTHDKSVNPKPALKCLSQMGVRHLAKRPWRVLSQGERQKVFIARALIADLRLLILDEPCAGLDPVARTHFISSLSQLTCSSASPGIILVTHHVEEIFPEITHVLILKKGSVQAAGPKRKVLTSENLSAAFDTFVKVRRRSSEFYHLEI